jgi:hypothetical protein
MIMTQTNGAALHFAFSTNFNPYREKSSTKFANSGSVVLYAQILSFKHNISKLHLFFFVHSAGAPLSRRRRSAHPPSTERRSILTVSIASRFWMITRSAPSSTSLATACTSCTFHLSLFCVCVCSSLHRLYFCARLRFVFAHVFRLARLFLHSRSLLRGPRFSCVDVGIENGARVSFFFVSTRSADAHQKIWHSSAAQKNHLFFCFAQIFAHAFSASQRHARRARLYRTAIDSVRVLCERRGDAGAVCAAPPDRNGMRLLWFWFLGFWVFFFVFLDKAAVSSDW